MAKPIDLSKRNLEYWCDNCDCEVVHSNDINTGKFFIQFGHVVGKIFNNEYLGVVYALCKNCLKDKPEQME